MSQVTKPDEERFVYRTPDFVLVPVLEDAAAEPGKRDLVADLIARIIVNSKRRGRPNGSREEKLRNAA